MRDDRPREPVEVLDEWDDDGHERPSRSRSWVAVVLLVVALVVVAVVIRQGQPNAVDQVAPSIPSWAPEPSGGAAATTTAATTGTASGTAPRVTLQLPVLASDDAAQPLRVSLLDPTPVAPSAGLLAYRVQVCVSGDSAGVRSDTVRVSAANWGLASATEPSHPSAGVPGVAPRFPFESRLGKGQCASGYVTFAWNVVEPASVLSYTDTRFGWYWRLT